MMGRGKDEGDEYGGDFEGGGVPVAVLLHHNHKLNPQAVVRQEYQGYKQAPLMILGQYPLNLQQ